MILPGLLGFLTFLFCKTYFTTSDGIPSGSMFNTGKVVVILNG